MLDKFGYQLIVHRHFAKLEKIPVLPEAWMGIESFQQPRDYAILCCVLAFLENKNVYEQFLLSDICGEVVALYPGEIPLDWRNYEHRKSLVRVLQVITGLGMLKVVDGDTAAFNFSESSETLYEVSLVTRYFMRSYPKDLFQFTSKEEILAAEVEDVSGAWRRHRVYRQLVLSPVVYQREMDEADFLYIRNFRNRLAEDLEKHTGLRLEVYRQSALLAAPENRFELTLFPDQRTISDIALQFAGLVRQRLAGSNWERDPQGCLRLTAVEFQQLVKICRELNGGGWSKQYREGLLRHTADELLAFLTDWKLAMVDQESKLILLLPALARLTGEYPRDFRQGAVFTPGPGEPSGESAVADSIRTTSDTEQEESR